VKYKSADGETFNLHGRVVCDIFADLVAALEIARAYQARCERLEADIDEAYRQDAETCRHNTKLYNQLRNAEAACVDAGTFCNGPGDLVNAIGRLGLMAQRADALIKLCDKS
jgi:hypothetical protein